MTGGSEYSAKEHIDAVVAKVRRIEKAVEPDAVGSAPTVVEIAAISSAISLKRIADALCL